VAKARLLLEQRFTTAVSIGALAGKLFVRHRALIRLFGNEIGITLGRHVEHLRLNAQQRMLLRTIRSVETISAACAYSDARLFRQKFLKSPA